MYSWNPFNSNSKKCFYFKKEIKYLRKFRKQF